MIFSNTSNTNPVILTAREGTIKAEIFEEILMTNKNVEFSVEEILDSLWSDTTPNTVSKVLSSLTDNGIIDRVGRGVYKTILSKANVKKLLLIA